MFLFLMLAVATWMTVGWYVVGGFLPLYPIPLSVAILLMITTGKILSVPSALRNVLAILTLLAGWVLLSSMLANESAKGWGAVLNYLSGTAILMVTYHSIVSFQQIRRALGIYSVIAAAGLCLGFLQMATGGFYPSEAAYIGTPTGFEGMNYAFGKNFLPLVAAGVALLAFSFLNIGSLSKAKWWLLGVGCLGIAISGSRSTQLGAVAIFLTAIVVSRRWQLLWLGAIVLAAFMGLVLTSSKWAQIFEESLITASGGRLGFWEAAWHMVQEHPFFGVGAGNFKLMMPQYLSYEGALAMGNTDVTTKGIAAHNVYIGLAAESGIVAAMLYATFYFYITWLCYRIARRPYASVESRIIAYAGLFYMVGYFVDMNFHNYGDENTIWLFSGLILAMEKLGADRKPGFVVPDARRQSQKRVRVQSELPTH